MKVEQLIPEVSHKVHFSLKDKKLVPSSAGCYVLTTFDGIVLYVGLTKNLKVRFTQHRDANEKCLPTSHGFAFWFHYLESSENEIYRIERTWQNQHVSEHGTLPILNKIDSPVR